MCNSTFIQFFIIDQAYQIVLVVKNLPANAGDERDGRFSPWVRRNPGVRSGNPLQYSCLENSRDGEACWATVLGATKSQT